MKKNYLNQFFLSLFFLLTGFLPANGQDEGSTEIIEALLKEKISANYYTFTIDDYNNVFVTGFFTDTARISKRKLVAKGMIDVFFAKFDSSLELLWIKRAGGGDINFSKFINTDRLNNVYITGLFRGRAFFQDTIIYSGSKRYDYFTAKYNNDGDLQWVRTK
jgi:hypothetical protein